MKYTYAVLGAGRQGTASAYDMARWGEAERIILCDRDLEIAVKAAERVNRLVGRQVAEATQAEATDLAALERVLTGVDAFVSAVPYYYNLAITGVAIQVKASMCDLGEILISPGSSTPSMHRPARRESASSRTAGRCPVWVRR